MINDATYHQIHALKARKRSILHISRALKISRPTVRRWAGSKLPPSQVKGVRRASTPCRQKIAARRRKVEKLCQATHVETHRRVTPKRRLVRVTQQTVRSFPSAAAITRELNRTSNGNPINTKTVLRDLRVQGFKPYRQPKGTALSKEQRATRVAFAKRMLRSSKARRDRLMFSDEKYFDTKLRRFYSFWAKSPQTIPACGYVQQGPKVMFLGFISRTHRRLVACEPENMTAESYAQELGKYQAVLRKHWFQQDNASPHTAIKRDGWFERHRIATMNWPAHSPDLNVIETLWAMLERDVSARGPVGIDEIKAFVKDAWGGITQSTLAGLCDEFDDRLRVCIEEDGAIVTRTKLKHFRARQRAA